MIVVGQVASLLESKCDAGQLPDGRIALKRRHDWLDVLLAGTRLSNHPLADLPKSGMFERPCQAQPIDRRSVR